MSVINLYIKLQQLCMHDLFLCPNIQLNLLLLLLLLLLFRFRRSACCCVSVAWEQCALALWTTTRCASTAHNKIQNIMTVYSLVLLLLLLTKPLP
jgi:hypothetical protein